MDPKEDPTYQEFLDLHDKNLCIEFLIVTGPYWREAMKACMEKDLNCIRSGLAAASMPDTDFFAKKKMFFQAIKTEANARYSIGEVFGNLFSSISLTG